MGEVVKLKYSNYFRKKTHKFIMKISLMFPSHTALAMSYNMPCITGLTHVKEMIKENR